MSRHEVTILQISGSQTSLISQVILLERLSIDSAALEGSEQKPTPDEQFS